MQQHTQHTISDDGLKPQVIQAPKAASTHEGPLNGLSYRQAQVLAVTIAAAILIVAVLICTLIASAL
jgi:hypothetical protein